MEYSPSTHQAHEALLELLFAHKKRVSAVFKDILGLHEIDYIAITHIDNHQQLSILSSTPALEYNLFTRHLWQYDATYKPEWFMQDKPATSWADLYEPERFDELYYLKQVKFRLPIGVSLSSTFENHRIIYSMASKKSCTYTQAQFADHSDNFRNIGLYCYRQLRDIFDPTTHNSIILPNTGLIHEPLEPVY